MNRQCADCYIRKFCYEEEQEEDWTCSKYVRPPEPTPEVEEPTTE